MAVCLNDVIFPIWYFQGIEQMKYITYISLISKFVFLVLIFVVIRQPSDYLFVPVIYGVGSLIAGFISLTIIFKKHKIKFIFQPFYTLKKYFIDSVPIFLSNVSISLYVSTNKVIIGTFLGMSEVAYYDLAEKLTSVMKIPQYILGQSLFPKISKEQNKGFVKKLFKLSLALHLLLLILVLLFSEYIILLLGGKQMLPALIVVNILVLTVPIIAMSNVFGIQLLLPFGFKKLYTKTYVNSFIFYGLLIFTLYFSVGLTIINISIALLLTEIFVTAKMFYHCNKNKLWS